MQSLSGNMYFDSFEDDTVKLKLFINNDWNWVEVNKIMETCKVS